MVVVKWSVCSPSTPSIRVRIPLKPTVLSVKLCLKRTKINKKEAGAHLKKKLIKHLEEGRTLEPTFATRKADENFFVLRRSVGLSVSTLESNNEILSTTFSLSLSLHSSSFLSHPPIFTHSLKWASSRSTMAPTQWHQRRPTHCWNLHRPSLLLSPFPSI